VGHTAFNEVAFASPMPPINPLPFTCRRRVTLTQRADDVSALSDARTPQYAQGEVSTRAFDKAVRRKPLARWTRPYGD